MLVSIPPFYTNNRKELFNAIKFSKPKYPKFLSDSAVDLLQRLLKKDPSKRLGFKSVDEIKNHPWFIEGNLNWDLLHNKKYDAPFIPILKNELDVQNFEPEFTKIDVNSHSMSHGNQSLFKHYEGKFFFFFNFFLGFSMGGSGNGMQNIGMEIEN